MSQIVSKWNDSRLRIGWTIRLNNGSLARITWISATGEAYTAKPLPVEEGSISDADADADFAFHMDMDADAEASTPAQPEANAVRLVRLAQAVQAKALLL